VKCGSSDTLHIKGTPLLWRARDVKRRAKLSQTVQSPICVRPAKGARLNSFLVASLERRADFDATEQIARITLSAL